MNTWMYAYKMESDSAVKLASELEIPQVKHEGTNVKGRPERTLINWGSSKVPQDLLQCFVLNHPTMVSNVVDKISTYEMLELSCRIPDWTIRQATAKKWILDGFSVLARTVTQGKQGEGITVCKTLESLIPAKVYCKYIPKSSEYRVHIFDGKVIGYQIRMKNPEWASEDFSPEVCTFTNGWQLKNLISYTPPEDVKTQALKAVTRSGLLFGAVDVLWCADTNKAFVAEINTAAWLNKQYSEKYANAIRKYLEESGRSL
jgi:glutathione synthase/RimK-type ligase-like ATP-grasp enzyme